MKRRICCSCDTQSEYSEMAHYCVYLLTYLPALIFFLSLLEEERWCTSKVIERYICNLAQLRIGIR